MSKSSENEDSKNIINFKTRKLSLSLFKRGTMLRKLENKSILRHH